MTPRDPLYKVFVSSTYLDNKDRRKLVQDAVTTAGMVWHGMELFTAEARPVKEACIAHAREADVLVGIIAHRYGWIPEGDAVSITEMEYDAARAAGKDCLMFQIDPFEPVVIDQVLDPGSDRWQKQEKLEAFRQKFGAHCLSGYFNAYTLQAMVGRALEDWREKQKTQGKKASQAPATPDMGSWERNIQTYGRYAHALHATLPVKGFEKELRVPIDIDDVVLFSKNFRGTVDDVKLDVIRRFHTNFRRTIGSGNG